VLVKLSWRMQLGLVAALYAAVLAAAALLILVRYLQYVEHPADVAAAGGMYAGGDLALEIIIVCMLLVPTFVLALVIRKSEPAYTLYAKLLFALSLTAPLSAGLLCIPAVRQSSGWLGWVILDRMFVSPLVVVAIAGSWFLTRFARARRWISYAGLVEVLTLALLAALFLFANHS